MSKSSVKFSSKLLESHGGDGANKSCGKRADVELEIMGVDFILGVCERLLVVRSKQMVDIWWQLCKGQIRQTFIKSSMSHNFHLV